MSLHNRKSIEPYIKDDIEYYSHQLDGIRRGATMQSFLLADEMGLGKAEAVSEPVLTPSGWSTMGDISPGDYVIGHDGLKTEVLKVFPQGVKEIVKVTFSDGSHVMCDWDHLWEVNTPLRKLRGSEPMVMTTRKILDSGLRGSNGNRKWFIPMVEPVEFEPVSLPLDPYLVGVLIGDGCLGDYGRNSVSISTDTEIVENLNLPASAKMGSISVNDSANYNCRVNITGIKDELVELGLHGKLSNDKFIPENYMLGSSLDRIAVLQGLLDTDGTTVESRGNVSTSIEYGTVSKKLAYQVRELVQSLGGTASIAEKIPTHQNGEGQLFYRMVLHVPSGIVPFRLSRKLEKWTPRVKYEPSRSIESIEYSHNEEAVCIRVDNPRHLYVTRDYIVTHNSLQALTIFGIDLFMKRSESMIIVCPTTLKVNWANEINKFMGDAIQYMILDNKTVTVRERRLEAFSQLTGPRILIVNYEQVKPHVDTLRKMCFDVMICDEAHMIKNPGSQRTKAIHYLGETVVRKFLITGSPILNHVNDLWSLGHMIDEKAFGSYYGFLNTYAVYGGYENKQIVATKNESQLNSKLSQVMIRRLKKDVLDLPEVNYVTRLVGLHPKQQKLYDQVLSDMQISRDENGEPEDIGNVLTKFLRLKQICGTTATVMEDKSDYSGKLDAAVWDTANLVSEGERVVVFTQYRGIQEAFVNRLVAEFSKMKHRLRKNTGLKTATAKQPNPVFVLNGDVPAGDRQSVVDAWTNHELPGVIVCIYSVAGVGLNMTAARYCQRLDKLFNPPLNQQAVDRIHRIGADTSQPVTVLDYLCQDTAEERVDEILSIKQKVSDSIVETDPLLQRAIAEALLSEKENRK